VVLVAERAVVVVAALADWPFESRVSGSLI
jgi:hypothetical protein